MITHANSHLCRILTEQLQNQNQTTDTEEHSEEEENDEIVIPDEIPTDDEELGSCGFSILEVKINNWNYLAWFSKEIVLKLYKSGKLFLEFNKQGKRSRIHFKNITKVQFSQEPQYRVTIMHIQTTNVTLEEEQNCKRRCSIRWCISHM